MLSLLILNENTFHIKDFIAFIQTINFIFLLNAMFLFPLSYPISYDKANIEPEKTNLQTA